MSAQEKWRAMGIERCQDCREPRTVLTRASGCGCELVLCGCPTRRRRSLRVQHDDACPGCFLVGLALLVRRMA